MIRQTIIVVLFLCFVSTSSVLAGTWRDDFEDGNLNGWEGLDACWTVEDGECSGEFFNPAMADVIRIGWWDDCTVECKMKFVGAPSGFADISVRDTGMDCYLFFIHAVANTANCLKIFQNVNTQLSNTPLPFALSNDIWYELKIIVKGDNFEFYIDGNPAGEFKDNSIPSGKVGLVVKNAHVHFDDLIISGDDVEDGGSWDPAKHPGEKAVESKGKIAMTWGKIKSNQP